MDRASLYTVLFIHFITNPSFATYFHELFIFFTINAIYISRFLSFLFCHASGHDSFDEQLNWSVKYDDKDKLAEHYIALNTGTPSVPF